MTLELDEDHYPTAAALVAVAAFTGNPRELLDAIKEVWHFSTWGWTEEDGESDAFVPRPVHRWHISTGGWSGNESLIAAMQENFLFWHKTWVQSRRGGHYIFELSNS